MSSLSLSQLAERVSLKEVEAEICRRDFKQFIQRSWKIIEPGKTFVPGWHLDAIAEHLQACVEGQIKRLIINIPPRHMKSISAAVDLGPWAWTRNPSLQLCYFSYAMNLSLRDSVRSRRLIQSNWYQDRYGSLYALTGDQNAKHKYENDCSGYRMTSSIGGIGTGEGGDIIVCFPAGTLISTARGRIPIELVRLGELVWSCGEDGRVELKPVTQCYTSKGGDIVEVEFTNGVILRCTPNHPIWTDERGWVRADECQAGETCRQLPDLWQDHSQTGESSAKANLLLPGVFQDKRAEEKYSLLQTLRGLRNPLHEEAKHASSLCDLFTQMLEEASRYLAQSSASTGILPHLRQAGASVTFACEELSNVLTCLRSSLELATPDGGLERSMDRWSSSMERSDQRTGWLLRQLQGYLFEERSSARRASSEAGPQSSLLGHALSSVPQEATQRLRIASIRRSGRVHEVYNLEVANNHTYFANDVLVHNCDDPHNVREAESDVVRQGVLDWWDDTVQTRLNDPKTGVFIVIMQRVHWSDLSGHILKEAGYDHLVLPAEYEPDHPHKIISSIGFKDPRKKEGEPLWPARYGKEELANLKMTAYARAGQLQQRPTPRGGAILLEKWWRKWDLGRHKLPKFKYISQSYDCAFSEKDRELSSHSARTTWGVFEIDGSPQLMLLDYWRERVPYYSLRKEAKKSFKEFKPDEVVVEKKASGISLIQDLRLAGLPVVEYTPDRDKEARAQAASILLETGKIWYLDYTWAKDVIGWCAAFPAGDGEDIVDTCTQIWLRYRNRWFVIPQDSEDDIEEAEDNAPAPRKRRSIYG